MRGEKDNADDHCYGISRGDGGGDGGGDDDDGDDSFNPVRSTHTSAVARVTASAEIHGDVTAVLLERTVGAYSFTVSRSSTI